MNNETEGKVSKMGMFFIIIAFLSSLYSLIAGFMDSGLFVFSYFTTLANLLVTFVMAIELIRKCAGNSKQPEFITAVKFVMAVSIGVTFLVFMLLLAPTDAKGFIGAYQDNHYASLCAHFIAPISSLVYYFKFDPGVPIRKGRLIAYSVVFPFVYSVYAFVLGQLGARWDGMRMPYNFLNYDAPCGFFGFRLDTISDTTLGIGVFYMFWLLVLLFIAAGAGVYFIRKKQQREI